MGSLFTKIVLGVLCMSLSTKYKSDIEIAQEAELKPIKEIAEQLDLLEEELEPYGHYKAKISLDVMKRLEQKRMVKSSS